MIAIFFLSIPALAFLYIIHRIVSGHSKDARNLMRYDNPEAYDKMVNDERAERYRQWVVILVGGGIILVLILLTHH
jgi:hypothetical protein